MNIPGMEALGRKDDSVDSLLVLLEGLLDVGNQSIQHLRTVVSDVRRINNQVGSQSIIDALYVMERSHKPEYRWIINFLSAVRKAGMSL